MVVAWAWTGVGWGQDIESERGAGTTSQRKAKRRRVARGPAGRGRPTNVSMIGVDRRLSEDDFITMAAGSCHFSDINMAGSALWTVTSRRRQLSDLVLVVARR